MKDLRDHGDNMLTLGQYLQPSQHYLAVSRYVTPEEIDALRVPGEKMGFDNVASDLWCVIRIMRICKQQEIKFPDIDNYSRTKALNQRPSW